MTTREFVAKHRTALKEAIGRRRLVPRTASCYCSKAGTDHQHEPRDLTDEDLRLWVLSDEDLYLWARSEGVPI